MLEMMKRIAIVRFAAGVAIGAFALILPTAAMCIYDAVPLDGAWEMAYMPEGWVSAACPEIHGVRIECAVPGCWEDMVPRLRTAGMTDEFKPNPQYQRQTLPLGDGAKDLTSPGVSGCFVYRRMVRIDRTNGAFLGFDCVRNKVRVWVNGKFIDSHEGFSTPFEIGIPDGLLKSGDNEIVLAVSNDPCVGYNGREVCGLTTRALFASTGGIEGKLELRFAKSPLSDVYVTTAKDLKSFTVHVAGWDKCTASTFGYEILDGVRVVAQGEADGDFTLSADGMCFWSPESPKRYELVLKTAGGEYRQRFGIRRFVADGEKLRLNGEFVYLRGVTEHCYFPKTVHLPRDLAYYRMITDKRKELGFNFVRFHTFVPPEEYLYATDELGMLVHLESPNFVTLDEYQDIVAFARRHPSVVIYCTGNETTIDDRAETYLEAVAGIVHDGTDALFTPMSAMRGVEYMLGKEEIAESPFRHNPARMKRLAAFCDFFTSYQLGATSYDSLNGAAASEVDGWGDAYCNKPRVSHEICINGSFPDVSLETEYPEGSPIVASGVFSEIRRQLASNGVDDRAETYMRNSSEWSRRIRKFTFEKVRSMRRTTGYDFLGDINTHWHTFGYFVGMMDEFYRLKPGEDVENVRRYNSAAVLVSDLGSCFNVHAGERKPVALSISNFASLAPGAALRLSLVRCDDGKTVWREERNVGDVQCGDVTTLGTFDVAFPAANRPCKYILHASFEGRRVSASNEWETYAFPRVAAMPAQKNLHVVENISEGDLLAAMARGERVLLLGAGPFKSMPTTYQIGIAGRPNRNYATVVKRDHPSLAGLPNDGYCGWQFRWLMEGGAAVQLEGGIPFDPVVEIVASDKFLVRRAALFEYQVGAGRLVVCSFKFGDGDPAAEWLKNQLVRYAASDAFQPTQSLSHEQLRNVIEAPALLPGKDRNRATNPNDPSSHRRNIEGNIR